MSCAFEPGRCTRQDRRVGACGCYASRKKYLVQYLLFHSRLRHAYMLSAVIHSGNTGRRRALSRQPLTHNTVDPVPPRGRPGIAHASLALARFIAAVARSLPSAPLARPATRRPRQPRRSAPGLWRDTWREGSEPFRALAAYGSFEHAYTVGRPPGRDYVALPPTRRNEARRLRDPEAAHPRPRRCSRQARPQLRGISCMAS